MQQMQYELAESLWQLKEILSLEEWATKFQYFVFSKKIKKKKKKKIYNCRCPAFYRFNLSLSHCQTWQTCSTKRRGSFPKNLNILWEGLPISLSYSINLTQRGPHAGNGDLCLREFSKSLAHKDGTPCHPWDPSIHEKTYWRTFTTKFSDMEEKITIINLYHTKQKNGKDPLKSNHSSHLPYNLCGVKLY